VAAEQCKSRRVSDHNTGINCLVPTHLKVEICH